MDMWPRRWTSHIWKTRLNNCWWISPSFIMLLLLLWLLLSCCWHSVWASMAGCQNEPLSKNTFFLKKINKRRISRRVYLKHLVSERENWSNTKYFQKKKKGLENTFQVKDLSRLDSPNVGSNTERLDWLEGARAGHDSSWRVLDVPTEL